MLCIYKYIFIYEVEVEVEVTTENALRGVDSFQSSQSLTVNFGSSAQVSSLLLGHKTYKSRNSTCLKKLLWQGSPRKKKKAPSTNYYNESKYRCFHAKSKSIAELQ